jgi:hypothetical protein
MPAVQWVQPSGLYGGVEVRGFLFSVVVVRRIRGGLMGFGGVLCADFGAGGGVLVCVCYAVAPAVPVRLRGRLFKQWCPLLERESGLL